MFDCALKLIYLIFHIFRSTYVRQTEKYKPTVFLAMFSSFLNVVLKPYKVDKHEIQCDISSFYFCIMFINVFFHSSKSQAFRCEAHSTPNTNISFQFNSIIFWKHTKIRNDSRYIVSVIHHHSSNSSHTKRNVPTSTAKHVFT